MAVTDISSADSIPSSKTYDAIVVGAGFGGLYMLYRLRQAGFNVRVLEKGDGIGGTWYWNRYPGARCDVASLEYSYSFSEELQQQWTWTERFAGQPEILRYLEHVADRFNLRDDIQLNTTVESMQFDEDDQSWIIKSSGGYFKSQFCIMATGCLSAPNYPRLPGMDSFLGPIMHTGNWPKEPVDFAGQRVGIIGTGSSAVQSLPIIAPQADQVILFQRTPNFSIPAHNEPLDDAVQKEMKSHYAEFRRQQRNTAFGAGRSAGTQSALEVSQEEREAEYQRRWDIGGLDFIGSFSDLLADASANTTAADYVKNKIRQTVKDPAIAEKLCPDHAIGCKRLCSDTGYYEAFNRDNVSLVDLKESPIDTIEPSGIKTTRQSYKLDMLILATGFDAMTGALNGIDIRGTDGQRLKDKWSEGARALFGLATAGFPNLFLVTGPGSPSVLAQMVTGVEHHAEWITDCIRYLQDNGFRTLEARPEDEQEWMKQVASVANETLFVTCNSWYVGANIPGKASTFLPYIGGFNHYESLCKEVAENGYQGFLLG